MTSALASLILYVYLGVTRHRHRLGRASKAEVCSALTAAGTAFGCLLLTMMLAVVFMAFQGEDWATVVAILAGVSDVGGAVTALILGIRTEKIYRKKDCDMV